VSIFTIRSRPSADRVIDFAPGELAGNRAPRGPRLFILVPAFCVAERDRGGEKRSGGIDYFVAAALAKFMKIRACNYSVIRDGAREREREKL